MKEQYRILSKQTLSDFPFYHSPQKIVPSEPDLLLEMTFSPKIYLIDNLSPEIESIVKNGVEWLDARIDCSPSMPSEEQIIVYENYRMPYVHQTYKLTNLEKQYGKLNWVNIEKTEFDFSRIEKIPLVERLIFKLEEDFGIVFIHNSVIDLIGKHVKDVWVRSI
ncbi:hypothetical protein ACPV5O_25940 [Vibrio maritimus]|uniref:hypothetical protein n=1 Tax=Vibrio maritimus TaxID=990268 RepID=UPI004068CA08